jgi:3-hydroxymyristoyl/3-hydroxydecanoyl-(acyl carrier protein) dehydratase
MSIEKFFTIDSQHPSLPGHFPGNPIVPGVVILEEVLAQIGQSLDKPLVLSNVPSVKFHSPLRPDEILRLTFDILPEHLVSFSCQVGPRLIASGQLFFQPDLHISPSPL